MRRTLYPILRYLAVRAVTLGVIVVIGCYLVILIANMGGQLDQIRRAEILYGVEQVVFRDPANKGIPPSTLRQMANEMAEVEFKRFGLDRPFVVRSLSYLTSALSLQLGFAEQITSDTGSRQVRRILVERLPSTLVLFGSASLILFFAAIAIALSLSRRYGSILDRVFVGLAPLSAAPGWFYGIFLILLFAALLRVLPWGGMVDIPPPANKLHYALSVLRHMILPVAAITIGSIFSSVYSWRTFFLIYSTEDYVDLAKAKGLSSRSIERKYILRPTLPTIATSFLLMLIGMWMGQIILESVFNWPGLGSQYIKAVNLNDTPVIVGTLVIYAYLLAVTVLVLDVFYVIVDPRVRVTGGRR